MHDMKLHKQQLFGGALECDLPSEFIDVATFRQVPDNQHAFVVDTSKKTHSLDASTSIVIELLEMTRESVGSQCAEATYDIDMTLVNVKGTIL